MFCFEGEGIQLPLKAGQYRPASEPPLKWRFAGGPVVAQHNTLNARLKDLLFRQAIRTSIAKNPIFLSSSRGVRTPCLPSGSAHAFLACFDYSIYFIATISTSLVTGGFCRPLIPLANSFEPYQDRQNVSPDLGPNCLTR